MAVITLNMLRRLAREKRRVDVRHDGVKGLYARAQASGRVIWYGRAKLEGEDRVRWFRVGEWSDYGGMTLTQATTTWLELRDRIKRGEDPLEDQRRAPNVSDVIDDFMERHVKRHLKASTALEYERVLGRAIRERWGRRKLHSISRRDVHDLIDETYDRCVSAGGTGGAANRTLSYVKKFFNWCVERELIEHSPATHVKKPVKDQPRERVLTRDEVGAVRHAIDRLDNQVHRTFMMTLLLAGQRRGETAAMRWDNVDLKERFWTIPRDVTKNKKPHRVPLSEPLVQTLSELPRFEGSSIVFTNDGETQISGFSQIKRALDKVTEGAAPWNVHALRATLSTHLQADGTPPEVIERLLNHSPQGVTRRHYALHTYDEEKRVALERWAELVAEFAKPKMSEAA